MPTNGGTRVSLRFCFYVSGAAEKQWAALLFLFFKWLWLLHWSKSAGHSVILRILETRSTVRITVKQNDFNSRATVLFLFFSSLEPHIKPSCPSVPSLSFSITAFSFPASTLSSSSASTSLGWATPPPVPWVKLWNQVMLAKTAVGLCTVTRDVRGNYSTLCVEFCRSDSQRCV